MTRYNKRGLRASRQLIVAAGLLGAGRRPSYDHKNMSVLSFFKRANPVIMGVGIPIAVSIVGLVLPIQYTQMARLAELSEKIDSLAKLTEVQTSSLATRIDDKFSDMTSRIEDRFSAIQKFEDTEIGNIAKKQEMISADLESSVERISLIEKDPSELVSRLTGIPGHKMNIGTLAAIDNKIYILPRNDAAYSTLISYGYSETSITPTVSGFKVEPISADAVIEKTPLPIKKPSAE